MSVFGYKAPIKSINGWTVGGTHKAWYAVEEKDYPRLQRERIYIQCNCNLGYDHQADHTANPYYDEVVQSAPEEKPSE